MAQTWSALLSRGISGIYVGSVRRRGGARVPASAAPRHVREYLLLDKDPNKSALTPEEFDGLKAGDDILKVDRVSELQTRVTFRVSAPKRTRKPARYYVTWDVVDGDCGDFPFDFTSRKAAELFGEDWVAEMTCEDPEGEYTFTVRDRKGEK
jgi:hypothetical protein